MPEELDVLPKRQQQQLTLAAINELDWRGLANRRTYDLLASIALQPRSSDEVGQPEQETLRAASVWALTSLNLKQNIEPYRLDVLSLLLQRSSGQESPKVQLAAAQAARVLSEQGSVSMGVVGQEALQFASKSPYEQIQAEAASTT